LGPEAARHVDGICTRFELAWKRGQRPRIEDFLDGAADSERSSLLAELILLEFDYRRALGEDCAAAEYTGRFPGLDPAWLDRAIAAPSGMIPNPAARRWQADTWPEAPDPSGAADVQARSFGDYALVREIARGGMGVVYEARQLSLQRRVAIKMILAGDHAGTDHLARFRTEARAVARLQHPHIVQIHEVGAHDGRPYLVLEYIDGGSLADRLAGQPQPAKPAALLVETLARAVHYAHEHGVVHRDLKPANVLLTADGTPKIADFGLAKCLDLEAGPSGSTAVVGTPSYMAPEQAMGRGRAVGAAADVYALGVILYQMLTGRPPLVAPTPLETLQLVVSEEPVAPRSLQRNLPRDLETICLKCLHKEPSRRYADAAALADDLHRFLADRPIQARRAGLGERAWRWCRRNPAMALLTASVSVLLVAAVLIALRLGHERGVALELLLRTEEAERQLSEQLRRSQLDRDREQRAWYFQRIALAEREAQARNVGRAEELLEECPFPLRGWEWHYLRRRCRQEPFTFREHRGQVPSVAISPDGKIVASAGLVGGMGEVRVWERATGKPVHRFLGGPGPVGVVFHPGGRVLFASGADRTLRAWDVVTGEAVRRPLTVPEGTGSAFSLAVSPDGRLLVTGKADNALSVRDAADFRELRALRGHTGMVHAAAFGPDGRLVTGSFDGTVRVWDTATGREVHALRGHAGPVLGAAFSRDGTRVASCGLDGTTRVWDALTGRHIQTISGDNIMTIAVAFSPDGRRLATGSMEKVVRVWDLQADQEALTLRGHTDAVMRVAFSPDGDQLVSCSLDGTVRVWDATPIGAAPRPGERTLRGHTGAVMGITFRPGTDPSGRVVLASASADQTVRFWDPATGEAIGALRGQTGPFGFVSFSRDGRRVVTTDLSGTTRVWDADSGKEIRTFPGEVARPALSPDGRRVAFSGAIARVEVRDVDTGAEVLAPFPVHAGPVMCLAVSPDGKRLATSSWDRTAAVWDAGTGRRLHTLAGHGHNVMTVEYSADGTRLVTSSWDRTAKLWDAATGDEIRTFAGHEDNVSGAALSPDGRWLASASSDNAVRVWDARTADVVTVLRGHTGRVLSVAFSPDGKYLASSSGYRGKGEVKVWDAKLWGKTPDRE
jgi:WD40 repeat protein